MPQLEKHCTQVKTTHIAHCKLKIQLLKIVTTDHGNWLGNRVYICCVSLLSSAHSTRISHVLLFTNYPLIH